MDCSMPGFPVHYQLPGPAQTHVHRVSDAIQPSHPLLSPSSPTFNLFQHQGLFQWVSSLHQVAKVLEFHIRVLLTIIGEKYKYSMKFGQYISSASCGILYYAKLGDKSVRVRPTMYTFVLSHDFTNKGPSSQGCGFSSSYVWMWELDHKERWMLKNQCFWTVVWEKTLESPLDCKEIQPVHSEGD